MVKKIFLAIALVFFSSSAPAVELKAMTNYGMTTNSNIFYDWQFDWDNMNAASPANIGNIVLGTVGAVTKVDTQFRMGGSRIKFWGVNLAFDGNLPSNADADWWDDYLGFFGFNLVRVHHFDNFYPNGILTNDGTTQTMNATAFGLFDYLVNRLKAKGIYLNLNMNVSRQFTVSDGVPDVTAAKVISPYLKGLTLFNSTLITLQKDYANKFLTHTNPNTSLAYKDEPAVAMIEFTNENSLTNMWGLGYLDPVDEYNNAMSAFPTSYMDELTTLWNTWLATQYANAAAVISAWGISGLSANETFITDHSTTGNLQVISPAVATLNYAAGSADINVTTASSTIWHVQYQKSFSATANKIYKFTVTLSADSDKDVRISIQEGDAPYTVYTSKTVPVTSTPTQFIVYGAAPLTQTIIAKIFFADTTGTVTVGALTVYQYDTLPPIVIDKDNVGFTFHRPYKFILSSYPQQMQTDITNFISYTVKDFYAVMRTYIGTTIGTSSLMATLGGGEGYEEEGNVTPSSDFYDAHTYFDHPTFPGTAWDSNNFTQTNESMIRNSTLGMVGSAHGKEQTTKTMPFTVSEWNQAYPNRYGFEAPILMAAYALDYDWDGLMHFAFSHDATFSKIVNGGFFDASANPQKMLMNSIGAYIFQKATNYSHTQTNGVFAFDSDQIKGVVGNIKGKTYVLGGITITPTEDGAVFIYSSSNESFAASAKLNVAMVGEVRNSNSGWDKGLVSATHYHWGGAPVQMQFIPVGFSMATTDVTSVKKMDETGTETTSLSLTDNAGTTTFNNTGILSPWMVINR